MDRQRAWLEPRGAGFHGQDPFHAARITVDDHRRSVHSRLPVAHAELIAEAHRHQAAGVDRVTTNGAIDSR